MDFQFVNPHVTKPRLNRKFFIDRVAVAFVVLVSVLAIIYAINCQ